MMYCIKRSLGVSRSEGHDMGRPTKATVGFRIFSELNTKGLPIFMPL